MPNTFTQIGTAQVAGSGGVASLVFSTIPNTYTDLVIYLSLRNANQVTGGIQRCRVQINSITTGYDNRLLFALAVGTPTAGTLTDQISAHYSNGTDATSGYWSNSTVYISNYANSLNKTFSVESVADSNNNNQGIMSLAGGILSNTAVITSLTVTQADGQNFLEHSTAYLYGVSNA